MSDERPSEVLGGLPRTRPHRRSQKRGAPRAARPPAPAPTGAGAQRDSRPSPPQDTKPAPRPTLPAGPPARAISSARKAGNASRPGATKRAAPAPPRVRQPAQPPGTPSPAPARRPLPTGRGDLIGSAVQVGAELAEIGISAGTRALRGVVARLPRP